VDREEESIAIREYYSKPIKERWFEEQKKRENMQKEMKTSSYKRYIWKFLIPMLNSRDYITFFCKKNQKCTIGLHANNLKLCLHDISLESCPW